MERCFVIQPFDRGPFDKRFDDVLTPAVGEAGLEAYRVDRDPSVTIPISAIETGIRDAVACLADISTNNPNVWFELGYALACRKPLVLICNASRDEPFPFDVQHRHVIVYKTDSVSDFAGLAADISARLRAAMVKEHNVLALAESALEKTEGLEPHEIAALAIIAESDLDPNSALSSYGIKQDMRKAGFTELATVLAVKALIAKFLVLTRQCPGEFNQEPYLGFGLTDAGTAWLIQNRSRLSLRHPPKRPPIANLDGSDDDLPF